MFNLTPKKLNPAGCGAEHIKGPLKTSLQGSGVGRLEYTGCHPEAAGAIAAARAYTLEEACMLQVLGDLVLSSNTANALKDTSAKSAVNHERRLLSEFSL